MVIEDFRASARNSPQTESESLMRFALAHPFDRLAAATVDIFVVLLPLIIFVVAPLKRLIMESLVVQNDRLFFLATAASVGVGLIAVSTYFSWFHARFGATLGKLLFGLRVVDIWSGRRPNWGCAIIRSLLLILEFASLGLAAMGIFKNTRRRVWHDLLTDTCVVTTRGLGVASPGVLEAGIVRGFLSAILVFFSMVAANQMIGWMSEFENESKLLGLLEDDGSLCSEVGDALAEWSIEGHESETRISMAMALFASGIVAKSCLANEVSYWLNKKGEHDSLVYLALAFVHSDQPELSNSYLNKACEVDANSDGCRMSQVVVEWSEENWEKVNNLFYQFKPASQLHLSVWAIRHFMKHGNFAKAIEYIDRVSPQPALASFLVSQRAKALWGLRRETEARTVFNTAIDIFRSRDREDIASWMCLRELKADCSGVESLACRVSNSLADARAVLIEIEKAQCGLKKYPDLEELAKQSGDDTLVKLTQSLALSQKGNSTQAIQSLSELLVAAELDEDVRLSVMDSLVRLSQTETELSDRVEEWMASDFGENRAEVGYRLFKKLAALKISHQVLRVGDQLMAENRHNETVLRQLIVVSFELGQKKRALQYWDRYKQVQQDTLNPDRASTKSRMPAASTEDNFHKTIRLLERESGHL